jgi:MoaA/NifB/PqqE/SkfB family radical SAM enzyme
MGKLYTPLKVFHFPEKLAALPADSGRVEAPLHIRIKPTNACNHRCRYCAYRDENLQLGKDMAVADSIPRAKMLEIAEDVVVMGVRAVTFSGGGEPLCYPHLLEAARVMAEGGVALASLTNGALLAGETAEFFAHRAVWLRVSMDGWDDASYSRYRGAGPGEYTRIMANMAAFKALGGPCYLGVSLIVDQENQAHVLEALRRLADAGVDSVKVSPCIVANEGAANNAYHRPFFDSVKEQLARAQDDLAGEHFEIYDSYHEIDGKFAKAYHWCPYMQVLPVIGADQNVYPCQDKAYNLDEGLLGSIRDQRFRDFWFRDKARFFRIDPARHCNHHCVANQKNRMLLEYLEADPRHLGFV